jgi:hypothetical protein
MEDKKVENMSLYSSETIDTSENKRENFLRNLKKVSQAESEITTEKMNTNRNILSRIQTYEQLVEPTGGRNSTKPRDSTHRKQLLEKMKFSINNSYETVATTSTNPLNKDENNLVDKRKSVSDLIKANEQRVNKSHSVIQINGRNTVNMYNTAQSEIRDKIRKLLEENDRDASSLDLDRDEFMKEKLRRIGIHERDFKELVEFYNKHASVAKRVTQPKHRNTFAAFKKGHSLKIPEIKEEEDGEEETGADTEIKKIEILQNDCLKLNTIDVKPITIENKIEIKKEESIQISPTKEVKINNPMEEDSLQSGLSNESYFSFEDVAPNLVSDMENKKCEDYDLYNDYGVSNPLIRKSSSYVIDSKENKDSTIRNAFSKTKESDQKTSQDGAFTKVPTLNNDISVDSEISMKDSGVKDENKQIFEYSKKSNISKAKQAARAILMELNEDEEKLDIKETVNAVEEEPIEMVSQNVPEKLDFEIFESIEQFVANYSSQDSKRSFNNNVEVFTRLEDEATKFIVFNEPGIENKELSIEICNSDNCELRVTEQNTVINDNEIRNITKSVEMVEILATESIENISSNKEKADIAEIDLEEDNKLSNPQHNAHFEVAKNTMTEFIDDHIYGNFYKFRKSYMKKADKFDLEDIKDIITEPNKGHTTSFKDNNHENQIQITTNSFPILKSNSTNIEDNYKPRKSMMKKKTQAPLINIRRLIKSEIECEIDKINFEQQTLTKTSFEDLKVDNSHKSNINIISEPININKHNFNKNKMYLEDEQRLSANLYPQRVDKVEIREEHTSKYQSNIIHSLDSIAIMQYNINPNLPLDPMFFDILCINCYECVKPNEVDEHSEFCIIHPHDYDDLLIKNDCAESYNARIYKLHESLKFKEFEIYKENNNDLNLVYNELATQIYDIFMNNNSIEDLEKSITKINDIMNKKLIRVSSDYKYPLLIYAKRISQLVFTKLKEMEKLLVQVIQDDIFDDIIEENKEVDEEDPEIADRLRMLKMELADIEKQTEKTKMEVEQWRQEAKMRENMLARPSSNLEVLSDIVSDVLSRNNESVS